MKFAVKLWLEPCQILTDFENYVPLVKELNFQQSCWNITYVGI